MAIDIGADAIDRALAAGNATRNVCYIEGSNPATVAGEITKVFIYLNAVVGSTGYVGTFTHAGSNVFSSRDYETITGLVVGLNERNVSLEVEIGDYIGIWMETSTYIDLDYDAGWTNDYWRTLEATNFPYSSYTFDNSGKRIISLYGSIPAEYPTDQPGGVSLAGLTRVSSVRHIYQPGLYAMQIGLGDIGLDIDIAETAVRKALLTAKEEAAPERQLTPSEIVRLGVEQPITPESLLSSSEKVRLDELQAKSDLSPDETKTLYELLIIELGRWER